MDAKELDKLTDKMADRITKEMYELTKTYGIHPNVVFEIYVRGVMAGKDAVLDYIEAEASTKQKQ